MVEVTEIYSNEQTENLVENNNLMPIVINESETELVPNQEEVEGIPIENKKIRKEKLSLKNKRRKTRKIRTERRNHGEEYQSEEGKIVAARKLKDLVECRKKCKERFCDSDRQCIFNEYWSLAIFDESKKCVENVQLKSRATISGAVLCDMRGRHSPGITISEERLSIAKKHILSIPTYESHYTRRDTQKRYLPSTYTLAQLYSEYKRNCDNPISRTVYEKLVHDLNIFIKTPKTDTCNTCDQLHMKINFATDEEKLKLQELADQAYSQKAHDKLESITDPTKKTLSFDLQQCLPTPQLETNVVFYKRQLWVYNLTLHDCDDGQAYCYMWSEVHGGRGANQIASFLKNHPTLKTVDHKFLLAGHTRMECDSDHVLIEKNKKKTNVAIYHPHDWLQLIWQTGKKRPFKVIQMELNDFYEYSALLSSTLQVKNVKKQCWRKIKMATIVRELSIPLFQICDLTKVTLDTATAAVAMMLMSA
ncbi:Uncharacterized protein FWK35_00027376, partial [Aphis craccivora]